VAHFHCRLSADVLICELLRPLPKIGPEGSASLQAPPSSRPLTASALHTEGVRCRSLFSAPADADAPNFRPLHFIGPIEGIWALG
jgi:hypothetical protein